MNLPHQPGCYLFKDKKGNIIYVGKAKDLKKRVSTYKNSDDPKTKALVKNISKIDYIATNTEVEALILENTLIKKHAPKYNIDLKDSKRYAFLRITDEDFPRLVISRRKAKGTLFGPFTSAEERDRIRQVAIKTFRLRTCKKMPKKPCLRHHISLCDAPCIGNISKTRYQEKIRNTKQLLRGHIKELSQRLKQNMQRYAEKEQYENALVVRDQLNALQYLSEKQNMERSRKYDEDVINFIEKDDHIYLLVFNVYKGTLANKKEYDFPKKDTFFEEFLIQFYSDNPVPKAIIIPKKTDPAIKGFLEEKRGTKVDINIPKQGRAKELLDLAKKNIKLTFFGNLEKLEALQKELKLKEAPRVIECFDISHISGTSTVGSMVQFRNGIPDKSNYRRFKIRTVKGVDDFKAIAEVVSRRYKRLREENERMPDLIVIDGGKGQLKSATEELKKLGLKIPIVSIAKREEEIYVPGLSIPLNMKKESTASRFIQEIRDEAHRFAIKYNRLLRSKKIKEEQ